MNDDESRNKRRAEIFSEAADIADPAARADYLDSACDHDPDLRSEIEALLLHDQDAGSFLEKPPEELVATFDNASFSDPHDDAWQDLLTPSESADCIGMLGPYEVVELIGRGGMGIVLRALDRKLNRVVAIKLLAPELAAQVTAVQRFLREARATAAVSHDHVVSIHAIDDAIKPPIIVMEMIDGQSLQQKIDEQGPLDVKSILRIGMQTASGLSAAHRQGLVHRDIKPANILLENGIEKAKLTDFGLARAIDDIGMTQTGQITGTPQYMSPEQAQGKPIDYRTDLFSLGCVMYAMCTGRAAFRADSAVAVMHRIVHETPRPVRELNEDIPDWLCGIVARLLDKNPDQRFESAEKVEEVLGDCLAHVQQPNVAALPDSITGVQKSNSRDARSPGTQGTSQPVQAEKAKLHFLRRVPVLAWIALLLFAMVFLGAIVEWTSQAEVASRANGILFYLLAVAFVLSWGAFSWAGRLLLPSHRSRAVVPPTGRHLAGFFTTMTILTGVFVWYWCELGQATKRDNVIGYFFGYGTLTMILDDPDTVVEFNGQAIELPASGVVTLRPKWPGPCRYEVHYANGRVNHGDVVMRRGLYAKIGSGVFEDAERVIVTAPAGIPVLPSDSGSYALDFNGHSSRVETTFRYDGSHPLTIEAFATPRIVTDENQVLVGDSQASGLALMLREDGHWRFGIWDRKQRNYVRATSDEPATADRRVHLAGVVEEGQVRLYVDGKLQGEPMELEQMVLSGLPMMIGANWEPGDRYWEHFAGVLDEVRISSVARYTEDHYLPIDDFVTDADTIVLFHFDEGSGETLRDSSGNHRHATAVDAVWVKDDHAEIESPKQITPSDDPTPQPE